MYFINLIKERFKNEKLDIYVDMDGVIADYEVGKFDFLNRRPLMNNIKIFKELNFYENITLNILSICREDHQIADKNKWLDKYAPFFKNRNIISKESHPNKSSKELKYEFLKNIPQKDKKIIFVDDDNGIIKYIHSNLDNIIIFQASSLID